MVWPLLLAGMGLLGGTAWARGERDAREQRVAEQYKGLLGAPGQAMGPPTESGESGWQAGRGLLADPANPVEQMRFAAGVMGLPGQQAQGRAMLDAAMSRAQGAGQFEASEKRQGAQYGQTEARLERGQTQGQELAVAEAARAAQQYAQTFAAQAAAQERSHQAEQERLRIARESLGLEKLRTGAALAKPAVDIPGGFMPYDTGHGMAVMPIPGTDRYVKAVEGAQGLARGLSMIDEMRDIVEGKEREVDGQKVRAGGVGTELRGPNAERLSTLHGQIVSDIGTKLRELGTMQAGDIEFVTKGFKDPTSWGAAFTGNSQISEGYKATRELYERKLSDLYEANPWLKPAPPAGTVPVGKGAPGGAGGRMRRGTMGSW
jgi:hypothetical protein